VNHPVVSVETRRDRLLNNNYVQSAYVSPGVHMTNCATVERTNKETGQDQFCNKTNFCTHGRENPGPRNEYNSFLLHTRTSEMNCFISYFKGGGWMTAYITKTIMQLQQLMIYSQWELGSTDSYVVFCRPQFFVSVFIHICPHFATIFFGHSEKCSKFVISCPYIFAKKKTSMAKIPL
jgi:hypothetical protein